MPRQLLGVSIREAARQLGISDTAIRKAIEAGRCSKLQDGSVDVEAVRLGMALTADPTRGGQRQAGQVVGPQMGTTVSLQGDVLTPPANIPAGAGEGSSGQGKAQSAYMAARTRTEETRAMREQLDLAERMNQVAEVAPMVRAVHDAMSEVNSSLNALADRLTPLVTPETDADKVFSIIEKEVDRIRSVLRDTLAQKAAASQG